MPSRVPFVDLQPAYREVQDAIDAGWRETVDTSAFIGGPAVSRFEENFAQYCGVAEAIGVGNGTDAMRLTLQALGVGPGDVVVTVPNTFVATITPAVSLGARPVFVDVDPDTANMSPAELAAYFSEMCHRNRDGVLVDRASGGRIAAVIPVHLYGRAAPMAELMEIAGEYTVPIVEDACQAHGARVPGYDSARAGSIGVAGCFSFYPAKNLGAFGDAGAVVTSDLDLASHLRRLRDHWQGEKYIHLGPDGSNSRLDTIQAAVLDVKLTRLDAWNARRSEIAARYRDSLSGLPVRLPAPALPSEHVYHLFVIRSPHRDELRRQLEEMGIGTGLHYPTPVHLQPGFARFGFERGTFPAAEAWCAETLSLPMYPHLSDAQVDQVIHGLTSILG